MISQDEQLHTIALTLLPGIGNTTAKQFIETVGSAKEVFSLKNELKTFKEGFASKVVEAFQNTKEAFIRAEKEIEFVEKNRIQCLTITDSNYPYRLLECEDAPAFFFFKGNADLNNTHIVSMVGTRKATNYGKDICNNFISELKELCPDVLIVSGLAYGIDIHSHKAALSNGLNTVAVLAHGLDRIYPSMHRNTAVDMVSHGGLITEFLTGTEPERFNFVQRNRIIAGIADATVVVESAEKGGSLITADLSFSYNRECFAFPGRISDPSSSGCNKIIKQNKAGLITSAKDFVEAMQWSNSNSKTQNKTVQKALFIDLTKDEQEIADAITRNGEMQINEISAETNKPIYIVSSLLFEMEMKGVVKPTAGGMYRLA